MEHTPSEPGVPGTNQEEGRYHAPALLDKGPFVARKTGAGSEEDWLAQATSDPAFWIKESEVG
jgi:hypothetical protein